MSLKYSKKEIKAEAKSLGFFACGIVQAMPVDAETATAVRQWISKGSQATMDYMANYTEKRLNPCLLVPGTKTIVSLAMNYAPAKTMAATEFQLAAYAYGQDYHDVMKTKLRQLATIIRQINLILDEVEKPIGEIRIFVDTAPVLERYWAQKAGLGWIGKNHQLIIPKAGSMFFLGEIFLPYEFDSYDVPMPNRCGRCKRCINACPTCAICEGKNFESERCFIVSANRKPWRTIETSKTNNGNKPSMGATVAKPHALGTSLLHPILHPNSNLNLSYLL